MNKSPEKSETADAPESQEGPPSFDPLLDQANCLPSFIWGSEGEAHHVRDVKDGEVIEDETIEDPFGYEPPDPSQFTADA